MNSPQDLTSATPLMKQYWELKAQVPDGLLFFRMGDFYELFSDDAVVASQILNITLTSRDKNKTDPMPMAGVPFHSAAGYIQKLLNCGKKIAIAEQMTDTEDKDSVENKGKGIVKREIIRILTPAVQFDLDQEPSKSIESHYLGTAFKVQPHRWSLALAEPSTGETKISFCELSEEDLNRLLRLYPVKHFLKIEGQLPASTSDWLDHQPQVLIENLPSNYCHPERAQATVQEQLNLQHLQTFFPEGPLGQSSIQALGTLIYYLLKSQKQTHLSYLKIPEKLESKTKLSLGPETVYHLDLLDGPSSLFSTIQHTYSSMGARALKHLIQEPFSEITELHARQEEIKNFYQVVTQNPFAKESLESLLKQVYDLDRIIGRLHHGLAQPRDTLALAETLALLPSLLKILEPLQLQKFKGPEILEALEPLYKKILTYQRSPAPFHSREGGIFLSGYHPELDHWIELHENSEKLLLDLEAQEKQNTGISSLKIKYSRVTGYSIEITTANLKSVPAHYLRKQSMVNGERFTTEALQKLENELLHAEQKRIQLEKIYFEELIQITKAATPWIQQAAQLLTWADLTQSLAQLKLNTAWCWPTIDLSFDLKLKASRHPMVDHAMKNFVPNDLDLTPMGLLMTGPNMGGKSTLMKQVAILVILGQMGAPVPAQVAHWGICSGIYTRIGAHDALTTGQSTFMVEMSELAHLLHHANERSLLILDEIGRGTSTFDGMSVAWATLEWIADHLKCRTLFATHYHELTSLVKSVPHFSNAHMAVDSTGKSNSSKLRFLYQLKAGATNDSYGIQVAEMAGLPRPLIQRAWKVLKDLEKQSFQPQSMPQLGLFDDAIQPESSRQSAHLAAHSATHPALIELESCDINSLTPLQALQKLSELIELAKITTPET
jgi:DNA mismatch repair protein MutS